MKTDSLGSLAEGKTDLLLLKRGKKEKRSAQQQKNKQEKGEHICKARKRE